MKICYVSIILRVVCIIVRFGWVWVVCRLVSFGDIYCGVVRGFCSDFDIEFLEKFICLCGSIIDSKRIKLFIGC